MHVVTAVHRFDDLSYAVCDPAGDMGECMQLGERQEGLCGRECMSAVSACRVEVLRRVRRLVELY